MIDKDRIEKLVLEHIKGKELFLVGIKVSSSNRINVLVDTMEGITIDECADLHRHIERGLDRNVEDFELQVSSPGLDMPFAVIEQYRKNEGKKVAVLTLDGVKHSGILKNVTNGGFELTTEIKVRGKAGEKKDLSFNYDQIKSVKEILIIK
ncbi:MAG TPA: ribosome assembly cofactor RimP [Bacteroidales bacterium]|jgi:ribosome maturation factor RimP|nr:ribosome assembly cofactor RimP [Bacteroidales bacterium]HNR41204.1 ribosome assembly cofactor RimP [Bacteroidales bacterium]HPM19034.1 ribosome assembly cofactor RimP [Bacteroidales bacterium]HQG77182.1 ribosome assembly cofactor RimP [Bacteroidales bacterium]